MSTWPGADWPLVPAGYGQIAQTDRNQRMLLTGSWPARNQLHISLTRFGLEKWRRRAKLRHLSRRRMLCVPRM